MGRASSGTSKRSTTARIGRIGEARAARWYRHRGYRIVARNWSCRVGELDIVAQRGRTVVICEVKTRSSDRFGNGAEAVTPAKQGRVRRAASEWLRGADAQPKQLRFDVAVVVGSDVTVHEGVF